MDKCYFCHLKIRWKDVVLADGCTVGACPICFVMVEDGKKIAKERGYDANTVRGGDYMTKVERKSEGGNYLKHKFVSENGVTALKIENAGNDIEFTNTNKKGEEVTVHKWQLEVSYDGQKEGDPNVWTMNNTSFNACLDLFGDETEKWIGKVVEITIGGEGEMKHIKVDTVRSKKHLIA